MANEHETSPADYDHIVRERVKTIIDRKMVANEAAIGRLNELESSWTGLNKDLEEGIKEEFELIGFESRAMEKARARLDRNPCEVDDENAFVLAGKVRDIDEKAGLPSLLVKVLGPADRGEEQPVIAEEETDAFGNFTVKFSGEDLEKLQGNNRELGFQVYSDPKTLVHGEDLRMNVRPGRIKDIFLNIKCGDDLIDRLDAGLALRENIDRDEELVRRRVANTSEAHAAFSRRVSIGLEDLGILKDELSIAPPGVPSRIGRLVGMEPSEEPEEERAPEDEVEPEPTEAEEEAAPELEDIPGIGSLRAARLRAVGIPFVEANDVVLTRVLGNLRIDDMKTEATALLRTVTRGLRVG
jgi:hypothetical protein